jgi:hypothetical protein
MSLGYYLNADVFITEEELLKAIERSGHLVNRNAIEKLDKGIRISEFIETIGVIIDLMKVNTETYPFGQFDTPFVEGGFIHHSIIDFYFDKMMYPDLAPTMKQFVLSIVFRLTDIVKSFTVLETHNSSQLCLITPNDIVIDNSDGIWDHPHFKPSMQGLNYREFDGIPLKHPGV